MILPMILLFYYDFTSEPHGDLGCKMDKMGIRHLPAQMLAGHRGRQRVEFRSADLVATLGRGMPRWGRELGMDRYLFVPCLGE